MRKNVFLLMILFSVQFAKAQEMELNNIFFGYSFGSSFSKYNNDMGGNTFTVLGPIHFGLGFGLFRQERWSGAVDISYAKASFDGKVVGFYEMSEFNLFTKLNYHWYMNERIDAYSGAGVGGYLFRYYDNFSSKNENNVGFQLNVVGCRFLFNNTFGMYSEVGFGRQGNFTIGMFLNSR